MCDNYYYERNRFNNMISKCTNVKNICLIKYVLLYKCYWELSKYVY